jgi:hypothetical protein
MRSRKPAPSDGLKYLDEQLIVAIRAEHARIEGELGHRVCGRYLGDRAGNPDVCWQSPAHQGLHL